jgi:hypothetical protein
MEEIGDMEDMEDFGGLSDGKRCFAETSTESYWPFILHS